MAEPLYVSLRRYCAPLCCCSRDSLRSAVTATFNTAKATPSPVFTAGRGRLPAEPGSLIAGRILPLAVEPRAPRIAGEIFCPSPAEGHLSALSGEVSALAPMRTSRPSFRRASGRARTTGLGSRAAAPPQTRHAATRGPASLVEPGPARPHGRTTRACRPSAAPGRSLPPPPIVFITSREPTAGPAAARPGE